MALPTMTLELAHAAALDAGNRSMNKHCRATWNEDDWNVATEELTRLWPNAGTLATATPDYEVMP